MYFIDFLLRSWEEGTLNTLRHVISGNDERFTCEICCDSYYTNLNFSLCPSHTSCIFCVRKYISAEVRKGRCEYTCPFCDEVLTAKAVNVALKRNRALVELIENISVTQGLSTMRYVFKCPTPDCPNSRYSEKPLEDREYHSKSFFTRLLWKKYRSDLRGDLRSFKCEACGYSYCVICGLSWTYGRHRHEQLSCEEYAPLHARVGGSEAETLSWKASHTKKCPQCRTDTEKSGGCRQITCRVCLYEYCWECGEQWRGFSGCTECVTMPSDLCAIL